MDVELTSKHYRRSELVQDGMEIACLVVTRIFATRRNTEITEKYLTLVKELYAEHILANRPALRETRTYFDRCPAVRPHQRNVSHFQKSFKIFPHLPTFPVS